MKAGSPSGLESESGPSAIMADTALIQEETNSQKAADPTEGHELDAFLGRAFDEKPLWADLYESIRDVFFPPKLPPLELTSTPIPVPDRMAVKRNPWATAISITVNIVILLLAIYFGRKVIETVKPNFIAMKLDVEPLRGPIMPQQSGGGGGGGNHSLTEASRGKLPKIEKNPIVPPMVKTFEKPKIPIEAAIKVQPDIQLPNNPLPFIGMKTSADVVLSNGTGSRAGMGSGMGGGLGSGEGNGYGPGYGGNAGGGVYRIGGGVSAPVPIFTPEAEFSNEARQAKYQGVCIIGLIVDAQGNPVDVHVVRALGMGLDRKAMEAVRQYKFKPAMLNGRTPVPVYINVEVNFRLY